jgi:hypothetical protein
LRTERFLRFIECQKTKRAWISFPDLAGRYGRNIGIAEGYEQLKRSVINGEFEATAEPACFTCIPPSPPRR